MNKETKKAIKDSIKHWVIMRRWVKKQNKEDRQSLIRMYHAIKVEWHDEDCALCILFKVCDNCPLAKKYKGCGEKDTAWSKVSSSKTWGEWYKHSALMLKQLRSLL